MRAHPKFGAEHGFAAIDALVALAILSSTVALALQAVDVAHRSSALAAETRIADVALRERLDTPVRVVGETSGHGEQFDWDDVVAPAGESAMGQPVNCARRVELRALRSGRRYRAATLVRCPRQEIGL